MLNERDFFTEKTEIEADVAGVSAVPSPRRLPDQVGPSHEEGSHPARRRRARPCAVRQAARPPLPDRRLRELHALPPAVRDPVAPDRWSFSEDRRSVPGARFSTSPATDSATPRGRSKSSTRSATGRPDLRDRHSIGRQSRRCSRGRFACRTSCGRAPATPASSSRRASRTTTRRPSRRRSRSTRASTTASRPKCGALAERGRRSSSSATSRRSRSRSPPRLGVPSVAIANFTWDWIYETHPGLGAAAPWLVPLIRARVRGTRRSRSSCPSPAASRSSRRVEPLPLIARHPTRTRTDTRAHFGLPLDRPAALLSFGGYGLPGLDLGVARLSRTTGRSSRPIASRRPRPAGRDGIVFLDEDRFVGTRLPLRGSRGGRRRRGDEAGLRHHRGMHRRPARRCCTRRAGTSASTTVLVRELPRFLRCRFISQDDLFAGRWREALDALRSRSRRRRDA